VKGPDHPITRVIGRIPYRLALAGGWIDQPFVSRLNPRPPGSMVVVGIEPTFRGMDRAGLATGTRAVALRLWNGELPDGDPAQLVRELYRAENAGKTDPSGSQDMIGLLYPGVNRLDYDVRANGGVFPARIESLTDASTARWLEGVIHILPVAQRPAGYNPLDEKRLEPEWIARLGRSGYDCFEAIRAKDALALGASMNECMSCWEMILPNTVRHATLTVDMVSLLRFYQAHYSGAMYSGCGGGYLFVISEQPVEGAFRVKVRTGR
jgi:hypothetical protein